MVKSGRKIWKNYFEINKTCEKIIENLQKQNYVK